MNNYNLDFLEKPFDETNSYTKSPTRDAFGKAIVDLGRENKNVIVLNANLEGSLKLTEFTKTFPNRSLQIGVAEQNMANIATGLALYGKVPFLSSYAAFSPTINLEQIRLATFSKANIKIISSHYGLNTGPDGVSAQMTEDISFLRSFPGITIITPADFNETYKAIFAIAKHNGPVYLRLTRSAFPIFTKSTAPFTIGKANILKFGNNLTIIATGSMVFTALAVANELEKEGVSTRVLNMHTIKPLDEKAIIDAAKETKRIITIEEHQVIGGLGSAVAEVIVQNFPIPVKCIGLNSWGESGLSEELYISRGLSVSRLLTSVKIFLNNN